MLRIKVQENLVYEVHLQEIHQMKKKKKYPLQLLAKKTHCEC